MKDKNEKVYKEKDYLSLSGIQHFAFCERQWGLIHIEGQWIENARTAEGRNLHQKADDPYLTETRGNVKLVRSVPLVSKNLGLYGVADVIELQKMSKEESSVRYNIVEYKRGKPKPDDRDDVQLCAQSICLEEMLAIVIDYGYLYYGETKHRHKVEFNECLRTRVKDLSDRMHWLFEIGKTPPPVKDKRCKNCSLRSICVPELSRGNQKIKSYLKNIYVSMKE
ncbi:MAG: CRISPR-associated protein Cas4 [Clostridiales bacterium]|nr:CRISPR-associated protein Cas4 [Clostridiales bacterium]MCF8022944.1 CRISPR-associated protein Cas4 [Clostridiales bacterium]